ncbi:Hypothetical predicted protein [Cloeon dipterum]|uniref:Uncharacterized protein n=1 Tax=Cloeon dipterum TaxID=197152 RepID=A0A8S1CEL5_9INSE|nr:Hypothetical predicted protein [Cloeon dipterum]
MLPPAEPWRRPSPCSGSEPCARRKSGDRAPAKSIKNNNECVPKSKISGDEGFLYFVEPEQIFTSFRLASLLLKLIVSKQRSYGIDIEG